MISASETPWAMTVEGPEVEEVPIPSNVVYIPDTVPKSPTKGAVEIKTKVNGILLLREENICASI